MQIPAQALPDGTPQAVQLYQTPTATPILPPALPLMTAPVLVWVDFLDVHHGWGLAVNHNAFVLRTVDGGQSWYNATPAGASGSGTDASLFALDLNTAWLLSPQAGGETGTLYQTRDGGLSWSAAPVPFGDAFLSFVDPWTGRALAERGLRGSEHAVELFQTGDGGQTWSGVFHNDPQRPGAASSLPLFGIKTGLTFRDANNGWVSGSLSEDGTTHAGAIFLYATRDGGLSWSPQALPVPSGYERCQFTPAAPIFFGQEGFLPLLIYREADVLRVFYVTHDGGQTWTGNPADPSMAIPEPGRYAFADAIHGWSWDGSANYWFTVNGVNWSGTFSSLDLSGQLIQLDFVPGGTGWALTRIDDYGRAQLYRSQDGGASWTPLIP